MVILIDKTFLQETGSFLVLLHMGMVGQLLWSKFTCSRRGSSLPAASSQVGQTKARMVWGRQRTVRASTHSHSSFSVWKAEILRCPRTKEGIHRALYGVVFGSYLLIALAEKLSLHLQPQQQSTADMAGSLPVLLQGLIGYESLRDGETSACLAENFKV